MTLFVTPRQQQRELWDGPTCGLDAAVKVFGADSAEPNDPSVLLHLLKATLADAEHLYLDLPAQVTNPRQTQRPQRFSLHDFLAPPSPTGLDMFSRKTDFDNLVRMLSDRRNTHSLQREMNVLRSRKSKNELAVMRQAGAISGAAMTEVMRALHPGMLESEAQAIFEFECARRGSARQAYVPVFASGRNALKIHYVRNDCVIGDKQVMSVDAGCELAGYASDITRTMPTAADGKFTPAQRDLYEVLLRVLKECTSLATTHQVTSLSNIHRRSVELLASELRALGFSMSLGTLERTLYPHYLSHWLGIDLHDTPTVDRSTILEEGMVLTIEPGLYIPDDAAFPKEYRGIGMRIEDDVAIGASEPYVLSADAPKELVDVEAVCSGRLPRFP
ncbi:intermediate cleaving peptidase 55 [Malassezia yamatoensis]|uniref:Intermediate cleaving peptidase 55 n=1 Tax=Malassezia yamatoensis TaxID=253288 RepID=A0AAJ5YSL5_9BASI|nr:intermediate cleaving peptidase 55 [Malassezia yamatoensis]